MRKIILDASFVLSAVKQKIDFVSEIERISDFSYQIFVPEQVLSELEKISKSKSGKYKTADREAARLSIVILKHNIDNKKIKLIDIQAENADSAIVKIAESQDIVATLDRELRSKLNYLKTDFLTIKQKKKLGFV